MSSKYYEVEVMINGVVRVPVEDYKSKEHALESIEMSDNIIELASNITIQNDKEFYVFVNKRSAEEVELYNFENSTWTFRNSLSYIISKNDTNLNNLSKLSGIPPDTIAMYAEGTRIPNSENEEKIIFSMEVMNDKEK